MEMISSTNREYFFGSIILKSNQTTSDIVIGDERTIVDGQQRLTTIAIFLKVLGLLTSDEWSIDTLTGLRSWSEPHFYLEFFDDIDNLARLFWKY